MSEEVTAQPSTDSVTVTFTAVVPDDTPANAKLFWAGTLNDWDPGPKGGNNAYDRSVGYENIDGQWNLSLTSLKNDTVYYKITRGSKYSSEEYADYTYRPYRKVIFDRKKVIEDTVVAWHDVPKGGLKELWPMFELEEVTDKKFKVGQRSFEWFGGILYASDIVGNFYGNEISKNIDSFPGHFEDTVAYYQRISKAKDNSILVLAGKSAGQPWEIYIDRNNDNSITPDEYILTESDKEQNWKGTIYFDKVIDGELKEDSIDTEITSYPEPPNGYASSNRKKAPSLSYSFPAETRKAIINKGSDTLGLYVWSMSGMLFTEQAEFLIDFDRDNVLQMGSGTNEIISTGLNRMNRFYQYASFELEGKMYEIADMDQHGRWLRIRPSFESKKERPVAIEKGVKVPEWNTKTTDGEEIDFENYLGKYVLLDFWGSWCGPCIVEIPFLKNAYETYGGNEFEIIGFAFDTPKNVKESINKYGISWPQAVDEGDIKELFNIKGYPYQILVNPDGIIVETGRQLRGQKLEITLEKYLN